MVSINVNPSQNGQIPEWLAKNKYTFPIVVTDSSDFADTHYGVSGTPANLVLNADVKLVFRQSGYGPGSEKTIEAEIRELLGLAPFAGVASKKAP